MKPGELTRQYLDGKRKQFVQPLRLYLTISMVALLERLQRTNENLVRHWGEVMFLLLPAFTLAMAALYRNRRMRFTEHLVQALHLHSFWFIVLGLLLALPSWALWPGVAAMAVYTLLAGRRVYGGRWRMRLLRGAVLGVLYTAMLAAAMALTLLVAILW